MANILKAAKRGRDLPRLTGGRVVAGQRYADGALSTFENGERQMPPLMYCATVTEPFKPEPGHREEYTLQLTEDEMLATVAEWLTMMNRRRIDAEIAARRKAERAICPSKISPNS